MCKGIDWQAVEAVGSVAALLLTGGLAWWETRKRRIDVNKRTAELMDARIAILKNAYDLLHKHSDGLAAAEPGAVSSTQDAADRALIGLADAKNCQLTEMPTPAAVEAMANARSTVIRVEKALLDRRGRAYERVELIQLLNELVVLKDAIDNLEMESSRLSI